MLSSIRTMNGGEIEKSIKDTNDYALYRGILTSKNNRSRISII